MTFNVNVPLSDSTYRRVKQWAELRQQNVSEAIADYLAETLPSEETAIIPPAEPDPALEREKAAYIRLHPQLKQTHFGQYVAIYNGRLIDTDHDYGSLFERIDDRYPDEFVWLTKVEEEPMGKTIVFRSPRFTESVR